MADAEGRSRSEEEEEVVEEDNDKQEEEEQEDAEAYQPLEEEESLAETMERLEASEEGLTSEEAKERLEKYGPNLIQKKRMSWSAPNLIQMTKKKGEPGPLEALLLKLAPRVPILRDGIETIISVTEIVPGDVMILRAGCLVPADGRILPKAQFPEEQEEEEDKKKKKRKKDKKKKNKKKKKQESSSSSEEEEPERELAPPDPSSLLLDERIVTGANEPVTRIAPQEIYAGSFVKCGEARAIVTITGENTSLGKTGGSLHVRKLKRGKLSKRTQRTIAQQAQVFCRDPDKDNLKDVNVVVLDKTSVLTLNRLAIDQLWYGGKVVSTFPQNSDGEEEETAMSLDNVARKMVMGSVTCSPTGRRDRVDSGMVECLNRLRTEGATLPQVEDIFKSVMHLEPFSIENKYCLSVCEGALFEAPAKKKKGKKGKKGKKADKAKKKKETDLILFARGIPTALLDSCEIIDEDGEEVLLDAEKRETFMKVLDECAISGRRGLGLASLTIPGVKGEKLKAIRKASSMEEAGDGWCLLGLLFFNDPPRDGLQEGMARLEELGVKVIVASSDNRQVTLHFAEEVLGWQVKKALSEEEKKAKKREKKKQKKEEAERKKKNKKKGSKKKDKKKNKKKDKKRKKDKTDAVEVLPESLGMAGLEWESILEKKSRVVISQCSSEEKCALVSELHRSGFVVAVVGAAGADVQAVRFADVGFAAYQAEESVKVRSAFLSGSSDNLGALAQTIELVKLDKGGIASQLSSMAKQLPFDRWSRPQQNTTTQ